MKKRLITFILCIIFAVSNMTVVFADTEESDIMPEQSNNMAFAKAIGLIDSEASGDENFTRAQLAKLVTRIILHNYESIEDAEYSNSFTDVESEDVPYVMTAVNYGILNGVGNGQFMPDSNVTYIQLVKTMVGLLGRDEEAKAKGGYPTGYMAVAIQEGITQYAPPDMNYEININAVANILKQMVNSKMVYVDNNGDVVDYNKSYLWHYCSIRHKSGIAESVRGVSLYTSPADYDVVEVKGEKYKIPENVLVTPDMLGTRVDVFYKEESGVNTIVHIEKSLEANVFLDSVDIENVTDEGYTYYNGKKDKILSIESGATVLYNNVVMENYNLDILNPFKNSTKDGNVILVDADGDKTYDLVKITAYESYVVSDVQNGIAYSKSRKFSKDLGELEENRIVNILLEPINPNTIEAGDILNVMTDRLGNITQIIVSIDTFSGVIDAISYRGVFPETVEVGGKTYGCSKSLGASANLSDLKVGSALKMYFNPEGRICEIDSKGFEDAQIGYLMDARKKDGMDSSYIAQILTSGGDIKVFVFAKKVAVTVGSSDEGVKTDLQALTYAGETDGRVRRQPVKYTCNSAGEISKITYPDFDAPTSEDGFYQYPEFDGETDLSSYYYRASPKSFGAKLLMGNNTIVFRVAEENDRDDENLYCVLTPTDFYTGNVRQKLEAYGMNAHNPMADIIAIRVNKDSVYEVQSTGNVYVVKSVRNALNADGEEIAKLIVAGQNAETELVAEPEAVTGIDVGDVIKYAISENAIVKNIQKIFSAKDMELVNMANPSQDSVSAGVRYVYGTVVYADENAFTVRIGEGVDALYESYPFAVFKKVVVDRSAREPNVYVGSSEILLGELDYGTLASKVFIHTSSLDCENLVIYK